MRGSGIREAWALMSDLPDFTSGVQNGTSLNGAAPNLTTGGRAVFAPGQESILGDTPGGLALPPPGKPQGNALVPPSLQIGGALAGKRPLSYDPLDLIEKYESGGRNILQQVVPAGGGYNPSVGRVTGPSSAGGYYQMIDSTWRAAARAVGIDTNQYPRAIDAPKELQRKAAQHLYDTEGFRPWAPYNSKLAQAIGWIGPKNFVSNRNQLAPESPLSVEPPDAAPPETPSTAGPLLSNVGSPWARLMALSAAAQGAEVSPVKVVYDPRIGAHPLAIPEMAQQPSELGALPQHMRGPVQVVGPGEMRAPPVYVTKVGMRKQYE